MSPNEIDRLTRLEAAVQRLALVVETDAKQNSERIRRLEAHMYGNPDAGVPGVVVEIDRVKGAAARSSKMQWLLISTVIIFVAERLLSLL